jgi:hypothetical protein
MIRLGAAMRNQPALANHVAIVHHTDAQGRLWVIEGKPSGTGWRQADDYLAAPYTISNVKQPKTDAQRKAVADGAKAMLGSSYDWSSIVQAAGASFGLDKVWDLEFGKDGEVPGAVICSSLAAYLYDTVQLGHPPGHEREVTPGDWTTYLAEKGWASKPLA